LIRQSFLEKVLSKADTVSTAGKGILLLGDLPVLTPRGRYSIEMFPSFLRLHGKSYDYKIQYSHISRLFQLPKPDQRYIYFVISVDPPIKQGQTRYPHIVLLFSKDETTEVAVSLTK
jgi:structure-specific recognition protein 1